jgi:AcrR family transcriptional regulator
MSHAVKPRRRRYRSAVRSEQAQRTRTRIIAAARTSFLAHGFSGTTIANVAAAADVAPETVYAGFRSKAGLLEAVVLAAVLRDDEPDDPLSRRWFRAVLKLPDLRDRIAALARHAAGTTALTSPIYAVMRAAGTEAQELQQLHQRLTAYRFNGQAQIVTNMVEPDSLRPELSVEDAATTFSALASPELHHMLTVDRGWSQKRYAEWLERTTTAALLAD